MGSTEHPLIQVAHRLDQALAHLDRLEAEVRTFLDNKPFRAVAEDHTKEGLYIIRAQVVFPPPPRLGLIAGDAIHNMRAALDNLFWAFASRDGDPPSNSTASFPVYRDKEPQGQNGRCWDKDAERTLRLVSSAVGEAILSVQPFASQEDPSLHPLWVLHRLWNDDKHQRITPVGGAILGPTLTMRNMVIGGRFDGPSAHSGAFQDGDILARFDFDPKAHIEVDYEYKASFYVALPEEGPGRGAPLDRLLRFLYEQLAEKILPRFGNL